MNKRFIKYFCIILIATLLLSCRSNKGASRESAVAADVVTTSDSRSSTASIDSVLENLDLSFDTLTITVEHIFADSTKIVRLKAVSGQLKADRAQMKHAKEIKARLDSTAYKISSAETSAEHAATTAVYDPPNTAAVAFAVLAAAILINAFIRSKNS